MGKTLTTIDDALAAFIVAQRMFFIATAPSGDGGHVNCSPKGGALHVLSPTAVAFVDRVGSGAETIAHLRQNGRIVVMLCAFEGPPRIVRLHGRGEVVTDGLPEFAALLARCAEGRTGSRSIVRIHIERIANSCGHGVPLYRYERDRDEMPVWWARKGDDGLRAYVREKNATSIDGLPALPLPRSQK